ncbi:MAG: adenosylmethionine--8-amino-7-oxononanoate transaminase [Spartobacteria bacterium]|nr:adenosylmethionine--8-amino-7-oxononanoate transaminase [Spartobacteria bacterium]
MDSAVYNAWDRGHVWHPYTRFSDIERGPLPLMVRGEGPYLYDAEGRQYVDAISSWWACALGHGNERIIRAIQKQSEQLQHSILGNLSHPRAIELARAVCRRMPTPDRHIMFASDGACAVEIALKTALQYHQNTGHPDRTEFAYLEGAYHGDTLGAISVGYLEQFHKPFRAVRFPATPLPVPDYNRSEAECLRQAEALFAAHGRTLAALIVEPMCQGSVGMRIYSGSYLSALATLAKEHGALLIADEIATGFGRTGRYFAVEHAGVDPDIMCLGKALSAGYLPISGAVVKDTIHTTFSDQPEDHTFYHGHTFCGNPIAAAAAVEALAIYDEIDIAGQARAIEALLTEELAPATGHPAVQEIRILGAMAAMEVRDTPGASGAETAQRIRDALFAQGILLRPLGRVLYLMPPITTPRDLVRHLAATLRDHLLNSRQLT